MGILGGPTPGEALRGMAGQRDLMRTAALSGIAALALTIVVGWQGTPLPGDLRVLKDVQGIRFFRDNEGWINSLGVYEVHVAVVAAGVIVAAFGSRLGLTPGTQRERTAAIWTFLMGLGLRTLSTPLKEGTQASRPSLDFNIRVAEDFPGYGFPSGNVYADVLVYGALAVVAPRLFGPGPGAAIRVMCIVIILLSGPTQMSAGAHWPSDVLGGYLWGAAGLCLAVAGGWRLAGRR